MYKIIQNIENIDLSLLLKDSCHTIYNGSDLYGSILEKIIFNNLLDDNFVISTNNSNLSINDDIYQKYKNITVFPLDNMIDCSKMDNTIFDEKKYYKIDKEIIFNIVNLQNLIAINILYYKNNGFIYINDSKIQTWDKNCYYKRFGYCNLNKFIQNNELKINISQEKFDTSSCKYETTFPEDKYLWLSELIFI